MDRYLYERIVDELNYYDIEYSGGHLHKHLNVEDGKLIDRVLTEHKRLATTFDGNEDEVMDLIKAVLLDDSNDMPQMVLEWFNDDTDPDDFRWDIELGRVVGHGFFKEGWHDWNTGAAKCTAVTIQLRKKVSRRSGKKFLNIVTAYPLCCHDDIKRVVAECPTLTSTAM